MKIHHEQASTKNQKGPRDPFIRNGKGLAPRSIGRKKYILEDTSVFDSISELMSFAYKNIHFQYNCDNENCTCENEKLGFIKFIMTYTKMKKLDLFYRSRPLIILNGIR